MTEWLPHDDTFCSVFYVRCNGGRPKKASCSGRPTQLQQHIRNFAVKVPFFSLSQVADESWKTHVTCTCCNLAANDPIRILPCRSLICSSCSRDLSSRPTFECPGCSSQHQSSSSTFTGLSGIEENLFRNLEVKCDKCDEMVRLKDVVADCAHHSADGSQTVETLEDVLKRPLEEEPSKLEKRAAIKVVSRILHQNETSTCTLSTGGRVCKNLIIIILYFYILFMLHSQSV